MGFQWAARQYHKHLAKSRPREAPGGIWPDQLRPRCDVNDSLTKTSWRSREGLTAGNLDSHTFINRILLVIHGLLKCLIT